MNHVTGKGLPLWMIGVAEIVSKSDFIGSLAEIAYESLANKLSEDGRGAGGACDAWRSENPDMVQRIHARPRRELFTPLSVSGGPSVKRLLSVRITSGRFLDNGEQFQRIDFWKTRSSAHKQLERPWIGATTFLFQNDVGVLFGDVQSQQPNISSCVQSQEPLMKLCGFQHLAADSSVGGRGDTTLTIQANGKSASWDVWSDTLKHGLIAHPNVSVI